MKKLMGGAGARTYHDPAVKAGVTEKWCRYGRLPVWCEDCIGVVGSGVPDDRFHCDMLVRVIARTSSARQGDRATEGSYCDCMSCERRKGYNTSARWRAARLFAKYPFAPADF